MALSSITHIGTVRYAAILRCTGVLLLAGCVFAVQAQEVKKIERIVFEELQIEGKIRRPQLVLIKAEQRPKFGPMVMQGLDSGLNVKEYADGPIVQKSPYSGAFSFSGTEISNLVP